MIKKLGMLAAIAGLLLLRPCAVGACSCAPPPSAAEALAQADSVFAGRVISIVARAGNPALPPVPEEPVTVVFEVETVWKGPARRTIVLNTVINAMSCEGYFFAEGGEFLVFAYRQRDGSLGVHLCSRTSELGRAAADLAALGAGAAPAEPADPTAAPNDPAAPGAGGGSAGATGSLLALLALGGLALIGGLAGLVLARRRAGSG